MRFRNRWIDIGAFLSFLSGACLPLIHFGKKFDDIGWPALGLMCGAAAAFQMLWIGMVTLPFGWSRYREYWRYYEQHNQSSVRILLIVLIPLILFGLAALAELFMRVEGSPWN